MKKINVKKQFLMTAQEIKDYRALPDNLPETKLTEKQKQFINTLHSIR